MNDGPFLADLTLGIFADVVDDMESVRSANENRLRSLTDVHGMNPQKSPEVAKLAGMVGALKELEHQAILAMNREVRKHPLWTAFKDERGIGEKQFARLLAVIRDPAWNDLYERPPTCRELRAYCGLHVIENAHPGDNATVDGKASASPEWHPSASRDEVELVRGRA